MKRRSFLLGMGGLFCGYASMETQFKNVAKPGTVFRTHEALTECQLQQFQDHMFKYGWVTPNETRAILMKVKRK